MFIRTTEKINGATCYTDTNPGYLCEVNQGDNIITQGRMIEFIGGGVLLFAIIMFIMYKILSKNLLGKKLYQKVFIFFGMSVLSLVLTVVGLHYIFYFATMLAPWLYV